MIRPRKHLGQNFLQDPNTARLIAGALEAPPGARVVEIGPGTGALTEWLLEEHPGLVAVEVDERAVEVLRERFPELDVRPGDVLDVDWEALAGSEPGALYVIGNLPYYITSPILVALIDARRYVRRAVLMMQLEVAERLVASPRTKRYGVLSVQVQLFARAELLRRVSRHVFFPKPDVTSALVRLDFEPRPDLDDEDEAGWIRRVVRTAFNQRRKMLRNSLRPLLGPDGPDVPDRWAVRRAEELTPEDFVELARNLRAGRNL